MFDVIVAGAGPAGLFLATRLAEAGLHVRCVGIGLDAPWPQHYGMWSDDAADAGLADLTEQVWACPEVVITPGEVYSLGESYSLLDNRRLAETLRERLKAAGGDLVEGRVVSARRDGERVGVSLADGGEFIGRLFVDATGWGGADRRPDPPSVGWQTAWGEVHASSARDSMLLMDFSHTFEDEAEQPSFLYRLPMGDRTLFEETVLVAAPAVPLSELRARLHQRMGWRRVAAPIEVERCHFAMGGELPALEATGLPFGAAAGMIHPATGYSLGHVLRWANEGAGELAELVRRGQTDPGVLWRAWAWPADRRRSRALYLFGMGVLMTMSLGETRRFFRLFFQQGEDAAGDYLRWRLRADELRSVMWRMFRSADPSTRAILTRSGMSGAGLRLFLQQVAP